MYPVKKKGPRKAVYAALALLASSCLVFSNEAAAQEPTPDPVDELVMPQDVVLPEAVIETALEPVESANNPRIEDEAVASYIDSVDGGIDPVDSSTLEVGTLELTEDVSAVVVAPEDGAFQLDQLRMSFDQSESTFKIGSTLSDERLPAGETSYLSDEPEDERAGSKWPKWNDVTLWTVQITVYVFHCYGDGDQCRNDKVGTAIIETQMRALGNDDSGDQDWQVRRWISGIPGTWWDPNGADSKMTVAQLWISSNLTAGAQENSGRTIISKSRPAEGSSSCKEGTVEGGVGPYSAAFTWFNCEDYDVWYGDVNDDVAHTRFNYDANAKSEYGVRSIAYRTQFTMRGAVPDMTYYQEYGLRAGRVGKVYVCEDDHLGGTSKAKELVCRFN